MRNNEANIFVFIASAIIGTLVAMNLSITRDSKRVFLNSKEYHDAYSYKNQLLNDISNLNDQYIEYLDKLKKYESNNKDTKRMVGEIDKEIENNNNLIGLTKVKGTGIKITLTDITGELPDDFVERQLKIIHDTDMIQVINDLKNAGAEAISINGLRLIDKSSVACNGAFLRINGVQVRGPFYIYAIGNKETLKSYMLADEGYLKSLMLRGIDVQVERRDNITIPTYNGEIKNNYVKSIKQ